MPPFQHTFAKAGEEIPLPQTDGDDSWHTEQAALLIRRPGVGVLLACLKQIIVFVSACHAPPPPTTFADYTLEVSPAHQVFEHGS